MEIIFAGIMIVFMVIFLVMMWTIYSGMKKFLTDNIEEALVVSGDYIGDRVKDLHSTMTGRVSHLTAKAGSFQRSMAHGLMSEHACYRFRIPLFTGACLLASTR